MQLHLGGAWFMLSGARGGGGSPPQGPSRTPALTVFVEDVDAHFAAARAAGARITKDLQETVYGERQYGVEDLEGHVWLFSQHVRDVSPEQWGARMAGRSAASHPAGARGGT